MPALASDPGAPWAQSGMDGGSPAEAAAASARIAMDVFGSMALLSFLRRRLAETALHHVLRIRGNRAIAPQPAHHLRQDRAAHFLAVEVHAPRVVHVIALVREGLPQPDILEKPVACCVVVA